MAWGLPYPVTLRSPKGDAARWAEDWFTAPTMANFLTQLGLWYSLNLGEMALNEWAGDFQGMLRARHAWPESRRALPPYDGFNPDLG